MSGPRFSYWTKGLFAAAVVFLSGLNLVVLGDATFADVTQGQWLTIVTATLVSFGGIVGLQETPAAIASSVRVDS